MKELCTREAYDESPRTAAQKRTCEQLSKHDRPESTTLDITPAADPLAPPPASPDVHENENQPTEKPANEELQEEPTDTTMTPGASNSSKGEKRTETRSLI